MVTPDAVRRIVLDAARLVRRGEMVVFGSASLSFWLKEAPQSRDVDLWVVPEERGEAVEALMGELSWYHERHNAYVEVLGPETFCAPRSWRSRARQVVLPEVPDVTILVPHPHDVLIAKLERMDPQDRDHVQKILKEFPLSRNELDTLAAEAPYGQGEAEPQSIAAFAIHLREIGTMLPT